MTPVWFGLFAFAVALTSLLLISLFRGYTTTETIQQVIAAGCIGLSGLFMALASMLISK